MTETNMDAKKNGQSRDSSIQKPAVCSADRESGKISEGREKEYTLSKQILKSGTSIGANLAESATAFSRKDFLSIVYISLKECSETLYWLELLRLTDYITEEMF